MDCICVVSQLVRVNVLYLLTEQADLYLQQPDIEIFNSMIGLYIFGALHSGLASWTFDLALFGLYFCCFLIRPYFTA